MSKIKRKSSIADIQTGYCNNGISTAGNLETIKHDDTSRRGVGGIDKKISKAISSAAVLVPTVCAEVAESFGASRGNIATVISSGLGSHSSADIFALTASTANAVAGNEHTLREFYDLHSFIRIEPSQTTFNQFMINVKLL